METFLPASRGPFPPMDEVRNGLESDLERLTLRTDD